MVGTTSAGQNDFTFDSVNETNTLVKRRTSPNTTKTLRQPPLTGNFDTDDMSSRARLPSQWQVNATRSRRPDPFGLVPVSGIQYQRYRSENILSLSMPFPGASHPLMHAAAAATQRLFMYTSNLLVGVIAHTCPPQTFCFDVEGGDTPPGLVL